MGWKIAWRMIKKGKVRMAKRHLRQEKQWKKLTKELDAQASAVSRST
jgi:hypothetical protein